MSIIFYTTLTIMFHLFVTSDGRSTNPPIITTPAHPGNQSVDEISLSMVQNSFDSCSQKLAAALLWKLCKQKDDVIQAERGKRNLEMRCRDLESELFLYKNLTKKAEKIFDIVRIRCKVETVEKTFPVVKWARNLPITADRTNNWSVYLKWVAGHKKDDLTKELNIDKLLDEIEKRKMSTDDFAKRINLLYSTLCEVINKVLDPSYVGPPPNLTDFEDDLQEVAEMIKSIS